jgi:hypothetical protein
MQILNKHRLQTTLKIQGQQGDLLAPVTGGSGQAREQRASQWWENRAGRRRQLGGNQVRIVVRWAHGAVTATHGLVRAVRKPVRATGGWWGEGQIN